LSAGAAAGSFTPLHIAWRQRHWGDVSLWTATFAAAVLGASTLFVIVWFIAVEAAPGVNGAHNLWGLLVARPWEPFADPPSYGILHAWVSTLLVTAIALALAVPAALAVAVFAAEIAPPVIRNILQPCLELLAGIPSVVYGFFGVVTLVPLFETRFDMTTGECILAAALILAVMVLPYVASTAAEALRSVPDALREAAYALGVTRWHVVSRVVMRRAMPGLYSAVALGFARAIGEALAVLILTGNSTAVPESVLDRGQPITALILTELSEAGVGSEKYHALFAAGALLVLLTVAINLLIWSFKRRMLMTHG
jgi:phosphate ABC transporter permease protein PstC